MPLTAIISYDDTDNDHDALMLGRLLADAGARLTLAYVRHSMQPERASEAIEERGAETLLARGARLLGDVDVEQRVILSASTGEGLKWLAEQEDADLVVFGSDYRTAASHVTPGRSAQTLLEGGPVAVALAPAKFGGDGSGEIRTIGVHALDADHAAVDTAHDLARAYGARVTHDERNMDLLIVGSRPEAPEGHVMISAVAQNEIENATCPVIVIARGAALRLPTAVGVS